MADLDRAAGTFDHRHGRPLFDQEALRSCIRAEPGLPEKVKIGHFWFAVRADKSRLHDGERKKGDGPLYGHVDYDCLEIILDPAMPPALMRDTLWHEVLHALFWTVGVDQRMTEEQYVRMGASMELLVLRENPDLVAYLLAP